MCAERVFSIEDGELNQLPFTSSRTAEYRDIDLSFAVKGNGELFKKSDAAAVKQAVKTLILTNKFEKPFDPNFGADLRSLLFELLDDQTIEFDIEDKIKSRISLYEPRARILEIKTRANPETNSVSVTITFQVINTEEIVTLTENFSRLR